MKIFRVSSIIAGMVLFFYLPSSSQEVKQNDLDKYLCWAASNGDLEQVKLILSLGAKINHFEDGATALMSASFLGHLEIVKFLVKNHCDIHLKNGAGTNALMYASMKDHLNIIKLLIKKGARVNDKDNFGQTALIQAAVSGSAETVQTLLNAGADFKVKTQSGVTALSAATKQHKIEIINLLKKAGARE